MKSFCFALFIALIVDVNWTLGAEVGMPQLNPEFWTAQIFWLVLVFSILYLIIWKIFLPKITYSIETRKSKTINDLHEAQKLKEKAESAGTKIRFAYLNCKLKKVADTEYRVIAGLAKALGEKVPIGYGII